MKRKHIAQVEMTVDGDSPVAYFHRRTDGIGRTWTHRRHRCPIYATAERKHRFIERVASVQKALCRTVER